MILSTKGTTPPVDIGELAATYSVVREIGRGGMGAVVVARHRAAGHFVAIKIATPDKVDAEVLARFTREARLMARLQHPNIVKLYDVRPIGGGRVGIVMEYVRGHSLSDALDGAKKVPFATCASILKDVGKALAHAHAGGVIHLDVKPANVLIDSASGLARLSDFGIARGAGDVSEVTAAGGVVGTPAYMSPEQIDGLELDGRSDTYGLGVLGWQLVTGQQPWAGEPLFKLLFKQKHEPLPSLRDFRPDTPPNLLLALEGALEKDRAYRWARVEDMLEQLESSEPTRANRERRAAKKAAAPSVAGMADQATVPIYRRKRAPSVEQPRDDATRELSARDSAPPPAPALEPAVVSRPPQRRWLPQRGFTAGAVLGGLIAVLLFRLVAPSDEREPIARLNAIVVVPGTVTLPAAPVSAARATPVAPPSGIRSLPAARALPSAARAEPRVRRSSMLPAAPATASTATLNAVLTSPMATVTLADRARALVFSGDSEQAAPMVDSALALDARNGDAYSLRARLRIARGDVREAWTDIELAARTGNQWEALALSTMLNARESGTAVARERIEKALRAALVPRRALDPERAVGLAAALVMTGDTSTALTLLELSERDRRLPVLLADPLLGQLRSSGRFDRVLRRNVP